MPKSEVEMSRPGWMAEKGGLWLVVPVLPTDYADYGGQVERWSDPEGLYPDCSCMCKWFAPLHDFDADCHDLDWGVCTNPESPRAGVLTWEHQAGHNCGYEVDEDDDAEDQRSEDGRD